MDTGGARLLRQALDRGLDLLARCQHQIRDLVDHDHDQRQPDHLDRLLLEHRHAGARLEARLHAARQLFAALDRLPEAPVEREHVAYAELRHHAIALVHRAHHPLQRDHRLVRLGHHRAEQMRNVLVDRQLDHLGVDQDELALIRRQPVQQRQDHGVERHRLARTGGAGDQQMRHARQVHHDGLATDVLAQRQGEARGRVLVGGARQQVAQEHRLALLVRQLDADDVAAGHHRDAHRHRAQRAGDVVGERDHARGAGAWRRLQLVQGDHRPRAHIDDLAAHAEVVERTLERFRGFGQGGAIESDVTALPGLGEELQRRQLELAIGHQLAIPGAAAGALRPPPDWAGAAARGGVTVGCTA